MSQDNVINIATKQLVNALQSIEHPQNIYDALIEVPTLNLINMNCMITTILYQRYQHDHENCGDDN